MTWEEVRDADRASAVAILPVGAVEAHGPHLPLGTDVIIAEAMAREAGEALAADDRTVFILPPLWYTAAGFAQGFSGTIGVDGDVVSGLVRDIASALLAQGIHTLAIANAHLDPANLMSLRSAAAAAPDGLDVVFLDLTRRATAALLTQEFQTGACHAGRFEGSGGQILPTTSRTPSSQWPRPRRPCDPAPTDRWEGRLTTSPEKCTWTR